MGGEGGLGFTEEAQDDVGVVMRLGSLEGCAGVALRRCWGRYREERAGGRDGGNVTDTKKPGLLGPSPPPAPPAPPCLREDQQYRQYQVGCSRLPPHGGGTVHQGVQPGDAGARLTGRYRGGPGQRGDPKEALNRRVIRGEGGGGEGRNTGDYNTPNCLWSVLVGVWGSYLGVEEAISCGVGEGAIEANEDRDSGDGGQATWGHTKV